MFRMLILILTASIACAATSEQAIRRVLSDQVQSWNQGNIDAFMQGYDNSPSTLFIGKNIERGYAAVLRRYHQGYPTPQKMGQLTFSDLSVNVLNADYASVIGTFHLTRPASEGGNASGVFSLLFHRTPAGWKIILDHTS